MKLSNLLADACLLPIIPVARANCRIGRKMIPHPVDVTSPGSIEELHHVIIAATGHIDVMVRCAGITQRIPAPGVFRRQ